MKAGNKGAFFTSRFFWPMRQRKTPRPDPKNSKTKKLNNVVKKKAGQSKYGQQQSF
jgi:hypothetical protein